MKVAVFVLAIFGLSLAEPPVNYLPPSNQYGAPAPGGFASHTAAIIKPNNQYGPPSSQYGAPDGGYQGAHGHGGYNNYNGYDDGHSEPANYNFEYHVQDNYGNDFGHEEARQGDVAQGKYFVLLPDGRRQIVEYVADHNGYKPKITYEGTANAFGYNGAGGYQNGGYPNSEHQHGGHHNGGHQNGGYQHGAGTGNAGYHY
ncbi:hypothetical protein RN001_015532 [Aquatica leii]|uniref:Uncharacterized protein n=1 Tax=Aquatica leii TaxID=1421715 RepID=A0AAN7P1X9_9COLE|nr:hypothetical protein RN001_015532 [Aquatica leii]